jgi:hypothetical protein
MIRSPLAILGGVLGAALALAACSSNEPPPAPEPSPPVAAPTPMPEAATPPRSPIPKPPSAATPSNDLCGAHAAQKYVGRSRTEIPIPVQVSMQRVACTTCPVTMDYVPQRLNFFFDASTGIIKQVKCG